MFDPSDYAYDTPDMEYYLKSNKKMEKQFVSGIRVYEPRATAPEFVKFNALINKKELMDWLATQPDEIRINVKKSQKGGLYMDVDTWAPETK